MRDRIATFYSRGKVWVCGYGLENFRYSHTESTGARAAEWSERENRKLAAEASA